MQVMYLTFHARLKALLLLTVCTGICLRSGKSSTEHLQARKGSKREWLNAFPEGLVLNRQQGNVALNANGQHLSNELLIISSSLHLHLYGGQMVQAPESDAAKHSEQSKAAQLHALPHPCPVTYVLFHSMLYSSNPYKLAQSHEACVMMKQQLARTSA